MKKSILSVKQFPLPNIITSLRMFLGFLILCFLWYGGTHNNPLWVFVTVFIMFLLIAFSDWLDGFIARTFKMTTNFGMVFDHIADKFCINTILIFLATQHIIFFIFPIAFISRDLIVNGIRIHKAGMITKQKNAAGYTIPASLIGKLKTATLFIAIIMLFLIIIGQMAHYHHLNPNANMKWNNFHSGSATSSLFFTRGARLFVYDLVLIIPLFFAIIGMISYSYVHLLNNDEKKKIYAIVFGNKKSLANEKTTANHRSRSRTKLSRVNFSTNRKKQHKQISNHRLEVHPHDEKLTRDYIRDESSNNLLLDETIHHDLKDMKEKINPLEGEDNANKNFYASTEHSSPSQQSLTDESDLLNTDDAEHVPSANYDGQQMLENEDGDSESNESNSKSYDTGELSFTESRQSSVKNNEDNDQDITNAQREHQYTVDEEMEKTLSDLFIEPSQIVDYKDDKNNKS